MSDVDMAQPPASDLVEAILTYLLKQTKDRERELALAKENLAKAYRTFEAFEAALVSGGSIAMALYDLQRRDSEMPPPDLSAVEDEELVREYLRLLDIVVHSKVIPPATGRIYDAHWEELKRRGLPPRHAELERWLQEAEKS